MKQSKKRKQLLLELVSSCELYHLNEKESMKFINNFLYNDSISRRSYYYYKKQVYEEEDEFTIGRRNFFKNCPSFKTMNIPLFDTKTLKKDYPNPLVDHVVFMHFFGSDKNNYPKHHQKLYSDCDSFLQKANRFRERLDSQSNFSKNIVNSIPVNATIRKEYIKCRKYDCLRCPHGPYYYAYWKEKNTTIENKTVLRKRYLGRYNPRPKNNNKDDNKGDKLIKSLQNHQKLDFSTPF